MLLYSDAPRIQFNADEYLIWYMRLADFGRCVYLLDLHNIITLFYCAVAGWWSPADVFTANCMGLSTQLNFLCMLLVCVCVCEMGSRLARLLSWLLLNAEYENVSVILLFSGAFLPSDKCKEDTISSIGSSGSCAQPCTMRILLSLSLVWCRKRYITHGEVHVADAKEQRGRMLMHYLFNPMDSECSSHLECHMMYDFCHFVYALLCCIFIAPLSRHCATRSWTHFIARLNWLLGTALINECNSNTRLLRNSHFVQNRTAHHHRSWHPRQIKHNNHNAMLIKKGRITMCYAAVRKPFFNLKQFCFGFALLVLALNCLLVVI